MRSINDMPFEYWSVHGGKFVLTKQNARASDFIYRMAFLVLANSISCYFMTDRIDLLSTFEFNRKCIAYTS